MVQEEPTDQVPSEEVRTTNRLSATRVAGVLRHLAQTDLTEWSQVVKVSRTAHVVVTIHACVYLYRAALLSSLVEKGCWTPL